MSANKLDRQIDKVYAALSKAIRTNTATIDDLAVYQHLSRAVSEVMQAETALMRYRNKHHR